MSLTPRPEPEPQREEVEDEASPPARKQIYLRTVYALNPGIPHYVDVPDIWK